MMAAPPLAGRRLLMTTDAVGGVWTYALDLAEGLGRAGVATTLVVLGPSPSLVQRQAAEAIPGLELVATGLPLDWTAREPADVLETAAAVRGLARGRRADVVHLNSPALAAIGGFTAPVVGACHSCLATWWSAVKDGPLADDFRWRARLLWQGLQACDALIAPTRAFALETARTYDVPAPHPIWNGRALGRPGTFPRQPIAFTSGRLWDEGKNATVADAAAARMTAPVHAAGPLRGPNGADVDLPHLRTLGPLAPDEVAAWLQRSAVFVSTALYEPFGLGVLEAAQAGCALVLSDIPTFHELWDEAAVFVDPSDAAGFARACDAFIADPAERAAWGRRARVRAARYSVEAMCEATLELYARLCPRVLVAAREAAA